MSVDDKKQAIRRGLTAANRRDLYSVARYLPAATAERVGLTFPCPVHAQDPFVAARDQRFAPREIELRWEPGLADGPTSARLAVVDRDATTGRLEPPAKWDDEAFRFVRPDGRPIAADAAPDNPWFRQVNAWATVQAVLDHYENPRVLGRTIPWGFAGNRLTIHPHAGRGQDASYHRGSRALRLDYFGDPKKPTYTSLSHDVLAHEAGHAVLDGIRPLYLEHTSLETAALHESIADLTALLVAFRHNHQDAHPSDAEVIEPERVATWLSSIAEEFALRTAGRPHLRTARNHLRLADLRPEQGHHHWSQLVTGALFDVLTRLAAQYLSPERQAARKERATVRDALWWAADRIGSLALQPLDLLPPADARFADYARAVLRNLEITDPADPSGYRDLVRRVFHERSLCPRPADDCDAATCPLTSPAPPRPRVFHDADRLSRSPTDAYHFLHDNRDAFAIPAHQDFEVVALHRAAKYRRAAGRLPGQIVVEYLWREEVPLAGPEFGPLAGKTTTLPCGGTLVLDDGGNLLSWSPLPGAGTAEGRRRRDELLERVAALAAGGEIGLAEDAGEAALGLGVAPAPVVATTVEGRVRLETAPHRSRLP